MAEDDPAAGGAGRREAVPVPSQKYEIWWQPVRQEATIAEAAAAEHVDRSKIMRIRICSPPRSAAETQ